MSKFVSLSFGLLFFSFTTWSQTNNSTSKECRISTGIGFAGATKNMKKVGPDYWLQLDCNVKDQFLIGLEFENFGYKQNGYFTQLPVKYTNEINVVNNSFSFLIKYNFETKQKLKLALASGWTYCIRHNEYYNPPNDMTSQIWTRNVTSFDDYRIPFIAEAQYPICKSLNLMTRLKYNMNRQNGNTYSAGIGLSLKL